MNTHVVDQKARDMARDATAAINKHEEVCAERWGAAKATMDDVKSILVWGITGLISVMAGLIAWLATHPPS